MKSESVIKQRLGDLSLELSKCEDPYLRADIIVQMNILFWVVRDER